VRHCLRHGPDDLVLIVLPGAETRESRDAAHTSAY